MISRSFLLLALACTLLAQEPPAVTPHQAPPGQKTLPDATTDALMALPPLPLPVLRPASPLPALEALAPGVRMARGAMVVLDGTIILDQGPTDGLEVLACLREGKTHESVVRLAASQGHLVKAACIAALGLADGQASGTEYSGRPARGTPVQLLVRWQQDGAWVELPASSLVRDRVRDRPYPELPWVYTGSRFENVAQRTVEGKLIERQVFMLDSTRSLAVNFDEPDALIASPFPGADTDVRFEINSRLCPPAGTAVELVIAPAILPLTIELAADGSLLDQAGQILTDETLTTRLAAAYPGDGPATLLRAIAVQVAPTVERTHDQAARTRLLRVAAAAKVWAVPLFVLKR